MKKLLYAFLALALVGCASGQKVDPMEKQYAKQVDEVYARLSVEERAAQLFGLYPSELIVDGKLSLEKCRERIPYGAGHICQLCSSQDRNADEYRELIHDIQDYLMNECHAGIPAIIHDEALGGLTAKGSTAYPQAIAIACSWNPDLLQKKTTESAELMRAVGEQLALSPMLDVIRTPFWARIEESCGEDGFLTAAMGVGFVKGLQSKGFKEGVAATTKHFLGYGGANTLPWKEIYEEVLLPHEAAIRVAGSKSLMTSYDKFRSEYAVASDTLINKILRGYLHYDGMIVSDYGAVRQGSRDRSVENTKRLAAEALNTGNDLEFSSNDCYKYLPELLADGTVSEEAFEKAVKRALMAKARAGLLDPNPKLYQEGPLDLDPASHRQTAYELATQSVVMLKNNGVLPLTPDKKVAVVGPNANSYWSMLGDYSYQSMQIFFFRNEIDPASLRIDSFLQAFKNGFKGEVNYERGCDWSTLHDSTLDQGGDERVRNLRVRVLPSPDPTNWDAAIKLSANSDVIIACMGENVFLSGENRNRDKINLPGEQEEFVKELIATGKPVVLVIFSGRPQVIEEIADGCAAVLQAWYPGEEGGNAVTDILTGKVNPSGKLCLSYPRTQSRDLFCYNNGKNPEKVAYPFGYGLSYTTYTYSDMQVTPSAKTSAKNIEVSCNVTNSGKVAGTEVVELYLSPASGQPMKPIQLKGFTRVSLAPGETKNVKFNVSPDELAWYSVEDEIWTISSGDYVFQVGASCEDLPLSATCTLKGKDVKKALRDVYFPEVAVN